MRAQNRGVVTCRLHPHTRLLQMCQSVRHSTETSTTATSSLLVRCLGLLVNWLYFMYIIGGSDGCVGVYDPRLPSEASRVATLRHLEPAPVVSVDSSKCGQSMVAAASARGHVCLWDPRRYTVRQVLR